MWGWVSFLGNGPHTVSESTVSNTELSVSFLALAKFWGEKSASSSQPIICVPDRTHRVFVAELAEFAAELSEFSLPKQYSRRNSIPPVSQYCPLFQIHRRASLGAQRESKVSNVIRTQQKGQHQGSGQASGLHGLAQREREHPEQTHTRIPKFQ